MLHNEFCGQSQIQVGSLNRHIVCLTLWTSQTQHLYEELNYIKGFVCTVWQFIWFSRAFKRKSNMLFHLSGVLDLSLWRLYFPCTFHCVALPCYHFPLVSWSWYCGLGLGLCHVVLVLVFVLFLLLFLVLVLVSVMVQGLVVHEVVLVLIWCFVVVMVAVLVFVLVLLVFFYVSVLAVLVLPFPAWTGLHCLCFCHPCHAAASLALPCLYLSSRDFVQMYHLIYE